MIRPGTAILSGLAVFGTVGLCAAPAVADVIVELANGKRITVPVNPGNIADIGFDSRSISTDGLTREQIDALERSSRIELNALRKRVKTAERARRTIFAERETARDAAAAAARTTLPGRAAKEARLAGAALDRARAAFREIQGSIAEAPRPAPAAPKSLGPPRRVADIPRNARAAKGARVAEADKAQSGLPRDLRQRIDLMPPGTWLELRQSADGRIRNTRLSRLFPRRIGHPAWGIVGPRAVIDAWSGGAYAPERRELYVLGGGHNDYGGNEVYAFNLDTLRWSRLTEPSSYDARQQTVDGTPRSRHTYDGVEWLPRLKRLVVVGGAPWSKSGGGSRATWLFDPASRVWGRRALAPANTLHPASAVNSQTGHLWATSRYRVLRFDPEKNVWSSVTGRGNYIQEGSAAFVPASGTVVVFNKDGLWGARTKGKGGGGLTRLSPSGEGPAPSRYHGIDLHPATGDLYFWNGAADVWRLTADLSRWDRLSPKGAAPRRNKNSRGVFGRWRYVPHLQRFIGIDNAEGNVWLFRPAADIGRAER